MIHDIVNMGLRATFYPTKIIRTTYSHAQSWFVYDLKFRFFTLMVKLLRFRYEWEKYFER